MAPIRVMTGLEPDNPLDIVVYNPGSIAISSVEVSTEAIAKSVEDLQQSMDCIHKRVSWTSEAQRAKHRKIASNNRPRPNFGIGDYVLVAVAQRKTSLKLFATWRGPFRITDLLNGYVFRVENIITGKNMEIHGDRIQLYCDSKLNVTEEIKAQFAFDNTTLEIEQVLDAAIHEDTGEIQLFVK